jgi:hypothetical protein
VLVLLSMLIDYFNGCTRAHSLGIAAQLKLWENLRWYLQVYDSILFGCLLKKKRLCHKRRKSLKTLKICSFLLDFIL